MTADGQDATFVAALDRERPVLQGVAYLLTDDPRSADELLDAVLADLLIRRTAVTDLRRHALRGLVGEDPPPALPGSGRAGIVLLDGSPDAGRPAVVTRLGRLGPPERAAAVLRHYAGLDATAIADLLRRTPVDAAALADRATAELQAGDSATPLTALQLAEALREAIPYDRRTSRGAARDLTNARRVVSHRRRRRVGLGVAAALVLLVLITQLRPTPPVEVTSPMPTPIFTSTPPRAPCDTSERTCQMAQLYAWQITMADVVSSYVDPGDDYFTVYRTADDSLNSPGFWVSDGGSLAIDLIRRDRGATEVSLQIATSREYAVTCGRTTETSCVSRRYLDGNRFTLTETSRVEEGIEVQHSPEGTQVITAIARNTGPGKPLPVDTGQLMQIVQDPRMRLPAR